MQLRESGGIRAFRNCRKGKNGKVKEFVSANGWFVNERQEKVLDM